MGISRDQPLHRHGNGRETKTPSDESVLQKAVKEAVQKAGITKPASPHHAFAILLRLHIRTVQELLGHRDVSTTMIYTHVLNRGGKGVLSPADRV